MVQSVYGVCDGYNIIFTRRGDTDLWDVDVPFDHDGQYVVALYAVDYAGNEGYFATVLFTVTRFCVTVKIIDYSYIAKTEGFLCTRDIKYRLVPRWFKRNTVYMTDYRVTTKMTDYKLTATKCVKCGGV